MLRRLLVWGGVLLVVGTVTGQAQGPLTNAMNIAVRTQGGDLMVNAVAAGGAQGPLTNFGNIMLRSYSGDLGVVINGGTATPDKLFLGLTSLDADVTTAADILFASESTTAVQAGLINTGANAVAPTLNCFKTRATMTAATTVVSDNDDLCAITAWASDGAGVYSTSAQILMETDAGSGSGDVPGRVVFFTTPDGSTTLTEAFRIDSGQNLILAAGENFDFGTAGVRLTTDADGAITFLGLGDGADEDFTINLDDTSNKIDITSSTSVDTWRFQDMNLRVDQSAASSIIEIDASSDAFVRFGRNTSDKWSTGNDSSDDSYRISSGNVLGTTDALIINSSLDVTVADAVITVGTGTGVTVNSIGTVQRLVYKVTVLSTQWISNATTHDLTIATLPAKSRITGMIADVTTAYACTATCTSSTLSMVVGKGSGGSEYLDSLDADAAAATFGDTDSERGASLDGIINGEVTWGSTQIVVARLISGTGNLGDGATTNLSQGTVTFYITTEEYP